MTDVGWIFKLLGDRFETKEEEVLSPGVFVQLRDMMMVDIGFTPK